MTLQHSKTENFNLQLKVNWTWLILAFLVIWTLATGYFPSSDLELSTTTYWIMAVVSLFGLFVSIVFHEFCHLIVARRFHVAGKKITLFIFGGVSDLEGEPPNPAAEFWIAIAGPVFSAVFGFTFAMIDRYGIARDWPVPVINVLRYLASFNYIIAIFNLIPAFPLDGGRVFRSILWTWRKDLAWATKVSSSFGVGFGFLILWFGIFQIFNLNIFNGVWMFFLGVFLIIVARASYGQLLVNQLLSHEPVEHAMKRDAISVSPDISLRELVDDIYKYHTKLFPVTKDGLLLGSVGIKDLKKIPEMEWPQHKVSEFTASCDGACMVSPKDDVIHALTTLKGSKTDELIVVDDGKPIGKLSLKDILEFLALKLELEGITAGKHLLSGGSPL